MICTSIAPTPTQADESIPLEVKSGPQELSRQSPSPRAGVREGVSRGGATELGTIFFGRTGVPEDGRNLAVRGPLCANPHRRETYPVPPLPCKLTFPTNPSRGAQRLRPVVPRPMGPWPGCLGLSCATQVAVLGDGDQLTGFGN